MSRHLAAACCCALVLATAVSRAAFVSLVNLDTYAGGVPAPDDLAGVTIPPGGVARLGVVIELLDGTNWESGLPEPNTLAGCSFSFRKTSPTPAGALRLVDMTGTAVNDHDQPWDQLFSSVAVLNWLRGREYQTAPALDIFSFSIRDVPPAGEQTPVGNSVAGASVIVVAEILVRGNGVPGTWGLTIHVPASFLSGIDGKPYYYAADDTFGHGPLTPNFAGTWIARNATSPQNSFVIEVTDGVLDCDGNGVPDAEESGRADCDQNGILDDCDVAIGFADDCNANGRPDLCDISENPARDCNGDQQLDLCQPGASDCDANSVSDMCQISEDPLRDCDTDGILDTCQGLITDCDGNGINDECELAANEDADCDHDGILDLCQPPPCGRACDLRADERIDRPFDISAWLRHVAMSGDTIVATSELAAFIFRRENGTWNQVHRFTVPTIYANSFRYPTGTILGDTVFLSLRRAGNCASAQDPECALIVRLRPTSDGWEEDVFPAPRYSTSSPVPASPYRPPHGLIALSEELLLMGQPEAPVAGLEGAGAVQLIQLIDEVWQPVATLTSPSPAAGDGFGTGIDLDDGTLLVTAPGSDAGCLPSAACELGAGYVFSFDGGAFTHEATLIPEPVSTFTLAGERCALRGDVAVLGAPAGEAAFVFRRIGDQWRFDGKLQKPNTFRNAPPAFGGSVAILDGAVIVGRPYDPLGGLEVGAVYVFRRHERLAIPWRGETRLIAIQPESNERFGAAIASDGARLVVASHTPAGQNPSLSNLADIHLFNTLTETCIPDGVGGFCAVSNGRPADCNDNGVPDGCDIMLGGLADCDSDGVPDECEVDCDGNGMPDECELAVNPSLDQNHDGILDACTVLYVRAGTGGLNHGTSWSNAFLSLKTCLDFVHNNPTAVSEVWVAAGTYKPTNSVDAMNSLVIPGGLRLLGGFGGWETAAHQRDPAANITILSGDRLGNDGPGFANRSDNHRHVITMDGVGGDTVISGFTIRAGEALSSGDAALGGGMLLTQSSPVIADCVFEGNRASARGGAVYTLGGSPHFINCRFVNNHAGSSGGAAASVGGAPEFFGSVFHGNTAASGAAVHAEGGALALTNCTLAYNTATIGGSSALVSAAFDLRNSILWGNAANETTDQSAQFHHDSGPLMISHSIIQGWTGGPGAFSADPNFLDAAGEDTVLGTIDDDLRLAAYSPAVDGGDTAALPADAADVDDDADTTEPIPLDAAGAARVFGACPVDIGAYEFDSARAADIDGDCRVALDEYALFAACLNLSGPGQQPSNPLCQAAFDTDADSDVDLRDFARWQPTMAVP